MKNEENWQKKTMRHLLTDMISTFRAFATSVHELKIWNINIENTIHDSIGIPGIPIGKIDNFA